MSGGDTRQNPCWLLLQVAFRAKHELVKLADTHGLSVVQLYTVCVMQPGEPLPMNRFCCLLRCDASNVTGIIDRLLVQGFIVREENPRDRRVKMIALTAPGERLRTNVLAELPSYDAGLLNRLNDTQKQQLSALLSLALTPSDCSADAER